MIYTTLNKIREHGPCVSGWEKLLKHLGKTKADDEQLSLVDILRSNGLDDALWCLRAVDGYDKEFRLYAVWCARQVQHLMKDDRSVQALDVAERYAHDKASNEELKVASDAAWDASNAARAARYASYAARAAARVAASDADWDDSNAASNAASDAAKAASRAASNAAWDAAWYASYADWAIARDAARAAAWAIARDAQEKEFIRMCENAHDIKENT